MLRLSRHALIICTVICAGPSFGQSWKTNSWATGWDLNSGSPDTTYHSQTLSSVAAYSAVGYLLESEALADAHPQAAPTSRSHGFSRLDQSDPANGILRQFAESRAVYFGSVTYPVASGTEVDISYGLQIENTAGIPLNIVFGNHIRGVLAQAYNGTATISEETTIEGFALFFATAKVWPDGHASGTGAWENALFSQDYEDPYLGTIPGFRLNSLQFYGTRSFAPGETDTIDVAHKFMLETRLTENGFQNGIGVADFTGTADLTIRAYDSLGNDRTSEINITIVPEPATMIGLGIGLAMVARRRRNSR